MKRIQQRNDLVLIRVDIPSVRLDHFERPLGRLRPAVCKKRTLEAAHLRNAFGERPLVLVVVKVGSMDQQPRLFADRRYNAGVVLPESVYPNTRR